MDICMNGSSLATHAYQIARALLGAPNRSLSTKTQLRFGNNGSLAIEISGEKAGTWYDHELETGGGMLDLIERKHGCDRADAMAWLKSIGIEVGKAGNGAAGQQQSRTAVYVYRDERGTPLFAVTRWGPVKSFTQGRYDPATETFIEGKGAMRGVPLVPYRLPELLASTGRIWIVEGEKDADRLAGLGLSSTTSPGGAGKWSAEFVRYFAGRDVAVVPDNDRPGKDHARDVAASLRPVARSVRIVELPALLPKQDVSDWLDHGHTVATLERLLVEPEPPGAAEAGTTRVAVGAAALLDDVHAFLRRFVAYPSAEAGVAHVLWIAHTHLMDAWESTPRIAFLSPEPASGKTRALEVSELLVPRPVEAVNVSSAYLFRRVASDDGAPTILFDEIDTVFGPKAKDNEEIRALLNAGHRRGAVTGRCVVRGKIVETEEIPSYCAVALAGLGWLPDTILTRSVLVRMRRRAPFERIEPYRRRVHAAQGLALRARLEAWAGKILNTVMDDWPEMPAGVEDRDADVWEALLAVANAAGGDWPARARGAAVALVKAARESAPSLGIRLLGDLRAIFGDDDAMSTAEILKELNALDEAPWSDLKGKQVNSRGLAQRLRHYGIKPKQIRIGDWSGKGYAREDLVDAWSRYLPPLSASERETSETSETSSMKAAATTDSGVSERVSVSGDVSDRRPDVSGGVPDLAPLKFRESAAVSDVSDVSHSAAADGPAERVGSCSYCRDAIYPEDMVRTDSGALLHHRCADPWERRADPPEQELPAPAGRHLDTCPTCGKPATGLMVIFKGQLHHQACRAAALVSGRARR